MPIGKNSIKRVANAGYSNVKTEAPDMENSTELKVEAANPVATKKTAKDAHVSKKSAPKTKNTTPTPAKKAPKKEAAPLVTAKKFAVGDELPTYLL